MVAGMRGEYPKPIPSVRSNIKIARRTKKRRGPVLPSATASMRKGQGDEERMRGGGGEGTVLDVGTAGLGPMLDAVVRDVDVAVTVVGRGVAVAVTTCVTVWLPPRSR
jgi:hypothetical protein